MVVVMKTNIELICKGCKDYDPNYHHPDYKNCHVASESLNKIQCPCSTCLIKGICEISCDLFRKYDELIIHEEST